MGGDRVRSLGSSSEDESSWEQELPELLPAKPTSPRKDGTRTNLVDGTVDRENGLVFEESSDVGRQMISSSLSFEANEMRRRSVYREVLQSYEELHSRSQNLDEAKSKILSYTPGAWIEKVGGMKLSDYDVPNTASILLIGPKGSGKSSLINRISRVFEVDKFVSERAQVSYNSSTGDGTFFLQEYMVPRFSTSFCLYDTRSLSDVTSENMAMLKRWMTKGVHHGELIIRNSDSPSLKTRLKCKNRLNGHCSSKLRKVNFVIYVVNGLSVLKSMESDDAAEAEYSQMIATTFNYPFLSFKDDKPVIVVTHGDLLSLSDRVRIRCHLGELLGILPMRQIFDIPESCDLATELTIVDLIRYVLEHADRNLPGKGWFMGKVFTASHTTFLFLLVILGIAIIFARKYTNHSYHANSCDSGSTKVHLTSESTVDIDWHAIRYMWLDSD